MSQVLLNGKFVDVEIINSEIHRFIGTFRPPQVPDTSYIDDNGETQYGAIYLCPCGAQLWDKGSVYNHWIQGHMDSPQYIDIQK